MVTSLNNLRETTEARRVSAQPLVLVADDDPDTRLLFRTVLEIRGYCVTEAADGEEIVRAAESARPDLILMDGSLPRQSGFDAARQIRRFRHMDGRLFLSPAMPDAPLSHSPAKPGATSTS
jgi:CheY-like chemotaxis protein